MMPISMEIESTLEYFCARLRKEWERNNKQIKNFEKQICRCTVETENSE